jgi:hypothetical protein
MRVLTPEEIQARYDEFRHLTYFAAMPEAERQLLLPLYRRTVDQPTPAGGRHHSH